MANALNGNNLVGSPIPQPEELRPLPAISSYLRDIATKAVQGVALGCLDTFVHWFLLTCTCFYPAYREFYLAFASNHLVVQQSVHELRMQEIELNSSHRSAQIAAVLLATTSETSRKEDENLVQFFQFGLSPHIPNDDMPPVLNWIDPVGAAKTIRKWMKKMRLSTVEAVKELEIKPMYGVSITALPPEITYFRALKKLSIEMPSLTEPPNLTQLPNLNDLSIRNCPITTLPDLNLPKLETLALCDLPITTLSPGFNPPRLKSFTLTNTEITEIPPSFHCPSKLAYFNLSGTNITKLPANFALPAMTGGWPPELNHLTQRASPSPLSLVELESVPASSLQADQDLVTFFRSVIWGPFQDMVQNDLSITDWSDLNNSARAIRKWFNAPEGINTRIFNMLYEIELGPNIELSSLPPEICRLQPNVLKLNVPSLTSLPDLQDLPLLTLRIKSGKMTSLPSLNLPKLSYLELSDIPLETLPSDFNPPCLKYFILKNTHVTKLPQTFRSPSMLWVFNLEGTVITELPEEFDLPEMTELWPPELDVLRQTGAKREMTCRELGRSPNWNLPPQPSPSFNPQEIAPTPLQLPVMTKELQEQYDLITFFKYALSKRTDIEGIPTLIPGAPQSAMIQKIRDWMASTPDLFDKVTELNLNWEQDNPIKLRSLPPEIAYFRKLSRLTLKIATIERLPDDFNLPNLEHLSIWDCQIKALPPNFNPPKLDYLSLCGLPLLETLPETFNPPQLNMFCLSHTKVTKLPPSFASPPKLAHFSFVGTNISVLPRAFRERNIALWPNVATLEISPGGDYQII